MILFFDFLRKRAASGRTRRSDWQALSPIEGDSKSSAHGLTFSRPSVPQPGAFAASIHVAGTWLLLALLGGCAVGPNYHRAEPLASSLMPTAFGDAAVTNFGDWKVATPSAHLPRDGWWELYHDSELNRLETLAATNNQQIAVALANLAQARAALRIAQADFYPQISSTPSFNRQRTSANTSPNSAVAGKSKTFNIFSATADAGWELDLWGRIRRQVERARAQSAALSDDLESLKLSVQAEVAMDYFTLRSLDAQSTLYHEATTVYLRALELTQNRRKSGVASELDVSLAETQLKSARAQIPAIDLQRARMRHALAVMCGQAATGFVLTPNTAASTNLPAIPLSVPSEWLESRPDIASAERQMAAANASIGIAQAAFYPRLMLQGSAGFESISAGTLFDWPSHIWSVGPSLQMPIFTGGRNRAQLASSQAAFDGAIATYRQTVIAAFQEVEDQLAAEYLLARQLEDETAALGSARQTLNISNNRYKGGVEAYLDVIVAQTTVLTHEQTVIQLRNQRLTASVGLIKALGAGWEQRSLATAGR